MNFILSSEKILDDVAINDNLTLEPRFIEKGADAKELIQILTEDLQIRP